MIDVSDQYVDFFRDIFIPGQKEDILRNEGDESWSKSNTDAREQLIFAAQAIVDGNFKGGDMKEVKQFLAQNYPQDKTTNEE